MTVFPDESSAKTHWWLFMVGFAGHAPGLWLFFRRTLPVAARRENFAAVLVALASMVSIMWLSGDWKWVVIVWLVGHFSWGARLAWHLGQDVARPSSPDCGQVDDQKCRP